jgi:hypothetical protein
MRSQICLLYNTISSNYRASEHTHMLSIMSPDRGRMSDRFIEVGITMFGVSPFGCKPPAHDC